MSTRQTWFPIRHCLPLCGAVLDTAVQGYRPSTPCGISFPNQHRLPLCGAVLATVGQGYAVSVTSRLTS